MQKTEVQKLIDQGNLDKVVKYLYQEIRTIKKFVLSNNGSKEDVNDVFQDGIVIFCQKVSDPNFTLTAEVKTYFTSICRNVWFTELRKRKKQNNLVFEEEGFFDETEEQKFLEAEQAFDKLSDTCKKLLNDFYVLKLSMEAIAHKLQLKSQKIAKDRKYKCLKKARKMYQNIHA